MKLARVKGSVVATMKHAIYEGHRLLLVHDVSETGERRGAGFIAIDQVQAGPGDLVLYVEEGNSARTILKDKTAPARAVICAIVDAVQREWPV